VSQLKQSLPACTTYAHRDTAPRLLNDQLGILTAELLAEANRRHDAALHSVSMEIKAKYGRVDYDRFQKGHSK
jgi:hypothetical protein